MLPEIPQMSLLNGDRERERENQQRFAADTLEGLELETDIRGPCRIRQCVYADDVCASFGVGADVFQRNVSRIFNSNGWGEITSKGGEASYFFGWQVLNQENVGTVGQRLAQ